MTTTAPAPAKKIPVTISLTISYEAKDDMTLAEFTAEGEKAKKIVEEARKLAGQNGAIEGSVKIGSQKLKI